jgi:L-ascorbate metabolism protein UlaG (beta-lactamase superfamily)
MAIEGKLRLTWLGHSTFYGVSPGGVPFILDPWVMGNPATPEEWKSLDRFSGLKLMLITHGHFDHIGDAVALAQAHRPEVVAIFETCHWLESKKVENTRPMNKGGSQKVQGITVTMTTAHHSCGILDDGKIVYGGDPCGYVLTFENGFRLYHTGDTAVFQDMALIRELYHPDLVLLPIGDHFTMGPLEAAKALELIEPRYAIPMHHGTFPLLTGTPSALEKLTGKLRTKIYSLKPGETIEF